MSEDELGQLSHKIDMFMLKMNDQHGVSALSLSAIVMARMMLLNDSLGCGGDFRKLCREVSQPFEKTEILH